MYERPRSESVELFHEAVDAARRSGDAVLLTRAINNGLDLVPFQQGVALELGLDEHAQLDVGQLKQTDGLLQLGGHHQLLALSQLQLRRQHHNSPMVARTCHRVKV